MIKKLKLSDLYYFKILVEVRSFNEMARKYYISQPKVSLSLKRLESELGVKLLEREKFIKGIELTKKGEEVLEFIEYLEKNILEIRKKIKTNEKEIISIAMPRMESLMVMNKYIDMIYREERIKIDIEECGVDELNEKLFEKGIDYYYNCYFKNEKLSKNEKFFIQNLKTKIYFNDDSIKDLKDLDNKVIVSMEKESFHQKGLEYLIKEKNINAKKIIYVKSIDIAIALIKSKFAVGFFIENMIEENFNTIDVSNILKMQLYLEGKKNNKMKRKDYILITDILTETKKEVFFNEK